MKNNYDVLEDYVVVYVKSKGEIYNVLIDKEDLEKVDSYKNTWCYEHGYIVQKFTKAGKTSRIYIHNLVMDNFDKALQTDHINHDKLDNRKYNLRVVTHAENMQNRKRAEGKTGYRGVTKSKRSGSYEVKVTVNGKRHSLYGFKTAEEANEAAITLRKKLMKYSKN